MVLFGLFGAAPEIIVRFEEGRETHRRVLAPVRSGEVESCEQCPVVRDQDCVAGQAVVRLRSGAPLEHCGIHVELVGTVERHHEKPTRQDFSSLRIQLAAPAESPITQETSVYAFSFGAVRFPYQSYDGAGLSLRYYVRVVIARRISDVVREATLWFPGGGGGGGDAPHAEPTPVELDVGLEDALHIRMHLDRTDFAFSDEITGRLRFLLVRVRVVQAEVSLVKKEMTADEQVVHQSVLICKQVLDGPASRGDLVPIHLDLAAVQPRLSPTMDAINKTFSVRYFVSLVLRDAEGLKFFKQVEIRLVSAAPRGAPAPHLAEYRLGLVPA